MKKFISVIALVAAMFTVNTTVSNAQVKWGEETNIRIHEVHTHDYINKGDDLFRMGKYAEAMAAYKQAREYNTYKGKIFVPVHEIDRKMDRCAEAMRRAERAERIERIERAIPTRAIPARALPTRNVPAMNNRHEENTLRDVTFNGLSYSTMSDNVNCHILGVSSRMDYTVVELEYITPSQNGRIILDKDTYLKDRNTGRKIFLRNVEGINTRNYTYVSAGESHVFRLYFDRISDKCSEVDLIESASSNWKFYHVPVM